MNGPRSLRLFLVVLGVMFFPAVAFYILSRGENQFRPLPIMGPRELPSDLSNDTIFHTVNDFLLLSQDSMPTSFNSIAGNIYVVNFFFTTCTTICTDMTGQMKRVQEKFKDDPEIKLLSFTVDPLNDHVDVLQRYASQIDAMPGKWYFITGDKKEIYDLARYGLFVTAMEGDGGPDDFIHSDKLILLDSQRRIRGYYNGTDYEDVNKLLDEILVLKWEQEQDASAVSN
jgi:protein SCO1